MICYLIEKNKMKILQFPKQPNNKITLGKRPGTISFLFYGPKKLWYQRILINLLGFKYEYDEKGFNHESSN